MDSFVLENLKDAEVIKAVIYALSGLILWDFFSSLRFDIDILRGRTPLSWSLLVYILARYASLLFIGGVIPQAEAVSKINCQAVWTVILLATTSQKCWGQALFIIRACAIWSWNRLVIAGLLTLWLLHWGVSLANFGLVDMTWIPNPIIPEYGACLANEYHWAIGVAYILTLATDVAVFSLAAYRLMRMSHAVRSPFSKVLINDGVAWCCLTVGPTFAAILAFYLAKTVAAQSVCLIISSTMHSLLACRAYRKLSDFAEALPASFCPRDKVANGTMLDPDTLARLAWMSGNHGARGEANGDEAMEKGSSAGGSSPRRVAASLTEVLTLPRHPRRGLFKMRSREEEEEQRSSSGVGVGVQVVTQCSSQGDAEEVPHREAMVMLPPPIIGGARQGSIATVDSTWSSHHAGGGGGGSGSSSGGSEGACKW